MYHEGLVVWLRHITLHFKVEISQQVRPNSLDLQISVTCTEYDIVHRHIHRHDTDTDTDTTQTRVDMRFFSPVCRNSAASSCK